MSERPYFRYSGKELEELFESSKEDCAVLENLKVELSHRKRKKSRLLEEKINKTLTEIYSKPIESTSNTQLEPPRLYRRVDCLSQAALSDSLRLS